MQCCPDSSSLTQGCVTGSQPDLEDAGVVVRIAFESDQPGRQRGPHRRQIANGKRPGILEDHARPSHLPANDVLAGKVAWVPVDDIEIEAVHTVMLNLTLRQHKGKISTFADSRETCSL